MCNAALAHRLAQRLIAQGAPKQQILEQYDRAIAFAILNQRIYQLNYDDDYDGTDGLCARVTQVLQQQRDQHALDASHKPEPPVLFIPWEKQSDIVPQPVSAPLRLRTKIGTTSDDLYYRLGVVFTVHVCSDDGTWRTVFRKTVHRRNQDFEQCEIPLADLAADKPLRIRFITDSYSRAQDRTGPSWKWALWQQPQLILNDEVHYDFAEKIADCRRFVRLDSDGKDRLFDKADEDSTGATFKLAETSTPTIAAFTPHQDGRFGVTVAEYRFGI
jgi:hypothetical protein